MIRIRVGRVRVLRALAEIRRIEPHARIEGDSILIDGLDNEQRMNFRLRLAAAGLTEWASYLDP